MRIKISKQIHVLVFYCSSSWPNVARCCFHFTIFLSIFFLTAFYSTELNPFKTSNKILSIPLIFSLATGKAFKGAGVTIKHFVYQFIQNHRTNNCMYLFYIKRDIICESQIRDKKQWTFPGWLYPQYICGLITFIESKMHQFVPTNFCLE